MRRIIFRVPEWASCPAPYLLTAPYFPRTSSSWSGKRFGDGVRFPSSYASGPRWYSTCTNSLPCPTPKPAGSSGSTRTPCATGGGAGPQATSPLTTNPGGAASRAFPPLDQALVKSIACEVVAQTQKPLSRQSLADLTTRARAALGKPISRSTVWRILHTDALKPWQYEYWIFPRDPQFAEKAGPILDLYAGWWAGQPLGPKDHIVSADEKTSIQARIRCHPSLEPAPKRPLRVEPEYERGGALQYLAAWDVRRGYVMGRCEFHTGIDPFGRLVRQVMEQEPYCSAERVFWIVDNGSSHRGQASVRRLAEAYPRAILVHTPIHASWLNQVEIYFSIIQRKVLTPNDVASLAEVEERLRLYEALSNRQPRPFDWKFDRQKLTEFLQRLETKRVAQLQQARAG